MGTARSGMKLADLPSSLLVNFQRSQENAPSPVLQQYNSINSTKIIKQTLKQINDIKQLVNKHKLLLIDIFVRKLLVDLRNPFQAIVPLL